MFIEIYKEMRFDLAEFASNLEYYIPRNGKNIEEAFL
jgi:hypothetical protein